MPLQIPGEDPDAISERLAGKIEGEAPKTEKAEAPKAEAPKAEGQPMTPEEWAKLSEAEQRAYNLKALKLTEDDLREIRRDILRHGFWTKEYRLWEGDLIIVLRNAHGEQRMRLSTELNRLDQPTIQLRNEVTQRVNLAGSLLSYDDGVRKVSFNYPSRSEKAIKVLDEAFAERYSFIDEIDPTVQAELFAVYYQFANILSLALANGAVSSF